jgi:putative transposase
VVKLSGLSRRAQPWVAHDALLAAWQGDPGGRNARRAYIRFVERGLGDPPPPPFREAFGGWVLGSERFLARLRTHAGPNLSHSSVAEARQLAGLDPKRIFAAVADFYGLDAAALSRRHDPHLARAVAAWLCRRHTEASLRELAESLGLSRADSVPNLTRRLEARLKSSPGLSRDLSEILTRANAPTSDVHPAKVTRATGSRRSAVPKTKNRA